MAFAARINFTVDWVVFKGGIVFFTAQETYGTAVLVVDASASKNFTWKFITRERNICDTKAS